ncbi:MAG: RnfABCDGE type electron transport complex subunit B [Firmicutes bacterium]|nr:RnfABCDGE type electron transport complex subunit B [Bacillota bacterium]MBQ2218312.1 RnfABCDGE type electron transport complex subunit B [Bacillota bacterium]MBQ4004818.1 RnfABCDGE type electron transport complex subunit B [Bacillota bacterium]MBR3394649.1 RnfABCDGE type electron transport complex subunit B [Bacillota bacterium]
MLTASAFVTPVVLTIVTGLIAAVLLTVAGKIFAVPVDETAVKIRECLPGANCGACGFVGCDDYAGALAKDHSIAPNKCVPGGAGAAAAIAAVLGVDAGETVEKVANVMCSGLEDCTSKEMDYQGIQSCAAVKNFFGGPGSCKYGCIGLGDCTKVCQYDAIQVCNGVAKVDRDKCVGCGMCANTCPQKIIDILPKTSRVTVGCSSKDLGKNVTKACKVGCIGCKMCEKTCKFDAIHVVDNLAKIDPDKCKNCGMCAKACPRKIIHVVPRPGQKPIVKVAPKTEDGAAPVKPSEITRPEAPAPGSEPEKKTE